MNEIPYYSYFKLAEALFGVPWYLLAGIAKVESSFQPDAVGAQGEQGLMQMMPTTWEKWGSANPQDPLESIMCAARYLGWLLATLDSKGRGSWEWALIAYNWGIGRTLSVSAESDVPQKVRAYAERVFRYALEYATCEIEMILRGRADGKLLP